MCSFQVTPWSRGTWEGRCPSPKLLSPAPSSPWQTNTSSSLFFPSDYHTMQNQIKKKKKTIFCSHEIFSFGEPSGKHFQCAASEQLSCYRKEIQLGQNGACVCVCGGGGTASYRRP